MGTPHLDLWMWRDLLLRQIHLPRTVVRIPLHEATGHVLAEDLRSPEDLPAAPIAAMDGFAVRRADLARGTCILPVSTEIAARPGALPALFPGTAARIMTGAPVPEGADAVIEVEATDSDPFGPAPRAVSFALDAVPPRHRHIRLVGEEVERGVELARSGDFVGAGLVGLARALGLHDLPVRCPLRIAIVVTGDELTDDVPPLRRTSGPAGGPHHPAPDAGAGTVRESNGEMLSAALRADGAVARVFRSGDAHQQLRSTLADAAENHDLVLTTGGIGQGAFDVVKTLLGEPGLDSSRFEHISLRPGGPQGFGHLSDGTPVIHLPGTPVGALVGYHLFVRPLLAGTGAEPRRVLLGERGPLGGGRVGRGRCGEGATDRSRGPGHVQALPGRLRQNVMGQEIVDLLSGRRLAPYGRADAIVLDGDVRGGTGAAADGRAGGAAIDGPDRSDSDDASAADTVLILPL